MGLNERGVKYIKKKRGVQKKEKGREEGRTHG